MSAGAPSTADRTWIGFAVRAVVALVPGAAITFSLDHSTARGFTVLGAFLVASGALAIVLVALRLAVPSRGAALAIGLLSVAAGVVAFLAHTSGAGVFAVLVAVWGIVTGAIEIIAGARGTGVAARDAVVSGILTAAVGVVLAVVPRDPVLLVGLFGAYAVVLGVFVGIGAFTVRDAHRTSAGPTANGPVETRSTGGVS